MSTDWMMVRQNLAAICKDSSNSKSTYNCFARREAPESPRVDASTDTWHVSQGVNPPPHASRVKGGVQQAHVLKNEIRGREALKFDLPLKALRQYGRPRIRN